MCQKWIVEGTRLLQLKVWGAHCNSVIVWGCKLQLTLIGMNILPIAFTTSAATGQSWLKGYPLYVDSARNSTQACFTSDIIMMNYNKFVSLSLYEIVDLPAYFSSPDANFRI